MEIKQLRYFLAVVQCGNFTRASNILHIAPSAIGLNIKHLEEELQTTLLHRHSRGVVVTDAGRFLAVKAQEILESVAAARSDLKPISETRRLSESKAGSRTAR